MKRSLTALLTLFTLVGPGSALADTTTNVPDCGYLNARGCSPIDNEGYNIYFGIYNVCDFGLYMNIHGKCVNSTRVTKDDDHSWAAWALGEQRDNIGKDAPLNMVATFGTHNSFSSYGDGFQSAITVDQKLSMYDQLLVGARYLRLDPYFFYDNMRLCHSSWLEVCEATVPAIIFGTAGIASIALTPLLGPFAVVLGTIEGILTPGRLYAYGIREIADWMDKNPNEFLIVQLHNDLGWNVTDATLIRDEKANLLMNPIFAFIGKDKILTPENVRIMMGQSFSSDEVYGTPMPSISQIKAAGKRIMFLTANDVFDSDGVHRLTFHGGIDGTRNGNYSSGSDVVNPDHPGSFGACLNQDGTDSLWSIGSHKFPQAGEDRSSSVSFPGARNTGYLNAPQVRTAVGCGYAIIGVDFLLNQGYSQKPTIDKMQPDMGDDYRREAAVWSFAENDYGNNGPAVMRYDGRWTTDQIPNLHRFACANLNDWGWPRNTNNLQGANYRVVISKRSGNWNQGPQTCSEDYGANYSFYAPSTAPENKLLNNAYKAAFAQDGTIGGGGIWLNYKTITANLLSASPTDINFYVEVPTGTDAPQQFKIYGPSNQLVNLVAFGPAGVGTFVQIPSSVVLDSTGQATINVQLTPGAANRNAGLYGNKILAFANTVGLSQVLINVTLWAKGDPTLSLSSPDCANSPCTITEGQSIRFHTFITRKTANIFTFTGKMQVRDLQTYDNSVPVDPNAVASFVNTLASNQTVTSLPLADGTTLLGYSDSTIALPVGSHPIATYYPGGLVDSPGISNTFIVKVNSFLAPSPATLSLTYDGGSIPGTAASITLHNPLNRALTVTPNCGSITPCWFTGSGSGTNVTLNYTATLANLSPGQYPANVSISDGLHSPVSVPITLKVMGKLVVNPSVIDLVGADQPVSQLVTGTINGFVVPVSGKVISNGSWLTGSAGVTANPSGLTPGRYSGALDFYSEYALAPVRVDVNFNVVPVVTIKTIPSGLPVTVDSVLYSGLQTFAWSRDSQHQIGIGNLVVGLGSQYLFKNWSDGGALSHQVVAPQQATTFTASLVEALPLTTSVSPASSGSITLNPPPTVSGLYPLGTSVQVQATPAPGMTFTGFRGDLTGTTNPQSLVVSSAKAVLASFESAGPTMYALAGAVDKTGSPVKVNISLVNSGRGAAVGAKILRISNVQILAGTGPVTPVVQTVDLGFIAPGTSATGAISFDWPATATRIRFTVEFGDEGTYRGSTAVSVFH